MTAADPHPDLTLDDIDLQNRDQFMDGVPHEWFTWLRANAPIHRFDEVDGRGYWVITKHADIITCNRDAKAFSSAQDRGGVVSIEDMPPSDAEAAGGNMMLMMDPPDHTRYRKLVNRGFTPRMIADMEPHIRELTTAILDQALAKRDVDFVVDVAAELPLEVIAELIGVPREDRHKIFEWSNRMIGSDDPEYRVSDEELMAAQVEMFMYAQRLADKHRADPEDDIIDRLLSAEVDGDSLSDMDFNLFFLLLSVAGNETTRNAITHGLNAFLENPDQYAALVADPAGRIDGAVEEILRWASPVLFFRRNATRDYELNGHHIAEGDKITLWYPSGNRDEDVFEDPFTFDIGRHPNPHVAFGGGGPHFCLGAQLARTEIKVLFDELARRVPELTKLDDPVFLRSNFIGGIKHLDVSLDGR